MVLPRINNPKISTTETFGGDFGNKLSDYFNGIDLGLTDISDQPIIGTKTAYKSGKLQIMAGSNPITFNAPDLTGTPMISFPVTMKTDGSNNIPLFEDTIQEVRGKIISAAYNSVIELDDPNISEGAEISWSKISKEGSKLEDFGNFDISNRHDGSSILWSSALNRWILYTPILNPDVLLPNKTVEPTANTDTLQIYRHDKDVNNQRVFITSIQDGQIIKSRLV